MNDGPRATDLPEPARLESVQRAGKIFELLAGQSEGASVLEITERIGATKGMVSRILASLEAEGYVQQDHYSRRFSLTLKLVALARRHLESTRFPDFCRPILRLLVQATGEQANLVLLGPGGAVLYAKEDSVHEVQVVSRARRNPWYVHCSASEKVYLASLPEEEALAIVARTGLPPLTPNTITSTEVFREELRRVRSQGYAANVGERTLEVNTVAVPIRDSKGAVVAALTLVGPASRFSAEKLPSYVPLLREAAEELSEVWSFPSYEVARESRITGLT